jgi:hypothetical protein
VLRIRGVYPGSEIFSIPDPNFFHPGSEFFPSRTRIHIKEFKYFNPKKIFKVSEIWSRLFIPDLDPGYTDSDFFYPSRIPDPGAKKGHRIPDPQHTDIYVVFPVGAQEKENSVLGASPEKVTDRTRDQERTGQVEETKFSQVSSDRVMIIDLESHLS